MRVVELFPHIIQKFFCWRPLNSPQSTAKHPWARLTAIFPGSVIRGKSSLEQIVPFIAAARAVLLS